MTKNNSENKLDKLAAFEEKLLGVKKTSSPVVKKNKFLAKKPEKKPAKKIVQKPSSVKDPVKSSGKTSGKAPVVTEKKQKPKKKKSPRKLTFTVCNSKKSCGEHYGPYIWERVCNENGEDTKKEEFEKGGITFKKGHTCQGLCKKSSNVRVEEPAKKKRTQFSYMTPLKAVKLAKSLQSGAAPENIKKL